MSEIELILVDPSEAVCRACASAFAEYPGISIVHGRFESLPRIRLHG